MISWNPKTRAYETDEEKPNEETFFRICLLNELASLNENMCDLESAVREAGGRA